MEEKFENWESPAFQKDMESELKTIRRNLRRRNGKLILSSVFLVLAILIGAVEFAIPALEKQYWDPAVCTYLEDVTDLELTMVTYNELFGHGKHLVSVDIQKQGFAEYSLDTVFTQWPKMNELRNPSFQSASVSRGEFRCGSDFWLDIIPGIFVRSDETGKREYYEYRNEQARKTLNSLPDYIEVYASITFPEDLSMDQLQQLAYGYYQNPDAARFLWAPLRISDPTGEALMPCGIHLTEYQSDRYSPPFWNDTAYPGLFAERYNWSGSDMEQHVKSMLKFSADQLSKGAGILPPGNEEAEYYVRALDYIEENGVKVYGSYVIASPKVLLEMMDDGMVSHIYLLDAWIGL